MRIARKSWAGAALWTLLAPFLLASLIHPSVMRGPAADSSLLTVICSADGPRLVALADFPGTDLPGSDAPGSGLPDDPASVDHRCLWACARDAVALPPAFALPLPASIRAQSSARADTAPPPRPAPRFARPPARASPELV